MQIIESTGNVFDLDKKYTLMCCISQDCAMGRGIAVKFQNRFNVRKPLIKYIHDNNISYPTALLCKFNHCNNIICLITKQHYYNKPTYKSFISAIDSAVDICINENIRFIGTYRLGCHLDKLKWEKVKSILQDKFKSLDIIIEVKEP